MKSVLYANNLNDFISQIRNNQNLQVVGGCTNLEEFPEKMISTVGIPDLSNIIRHERYLEVGPGASLGKLLSRGKNHIPPILYDAISSIANPIVRNMATIGGNICASGHKLSLFAPLMALDARLEFKNEYETLYEPLQSFNKIPKGFILSNIRIPFLVPELSIFRRIGPENQITQHSASFAFLADTERNSLVDIRLAFAGPFSFRSRQLENSIIGYHLPLSPKDISLIMQNVEKEFMKASTDIMISDAVTQQFLNLTHYSFEQLT